MARTSRSSSSTRSRTDQDLKIYKQGDWLDLCRGPHMTSTGKVGNAFKLMKVAGAYWRGDSQQSDAAAHLRHGLRRQEELDAYFKQLEEAEKRDHRKLGREMDLFHFQEEAPGAVFWHPKGWTLFQTLDRLHAPPPRRRLQRGQRAARCSTRRLWETSGHWEKYRENMFIATGGDDRGRARVRAQADELPGPRADLQARPEELSRPAAAHRRVRQGAPLRAVGRAARHAARARTSRRTTRTSSAPRSSSPTSA